LSVKLLCAPWDSQIYFNWDTYHEIIIKAPNNENVVNSCKSKHPEKLTERAVGIYVYNNTLNVNIIFITKQ